MKDVESASSVQLFKKTRPGAMRPRGERIPLGAQRLEDTHLCVAVSHRTVGRRARRGMPFWIAARTEDAIFIAAYTMQLLCRDAQHDLAAPVGRAAKHLVCDIGFF